MKSDMYHVFMVPVGWLIFYGSLNPPSSAKPEQNSLLHRVKTNIQMKHVKKFSGDIHDPQRINHFHYSTA